MHTLAAAYTKQKLCLALYASWAAIRAIPCNADFSMQFSSQACVPQGGVRGTSRGRAFNMDGRALRPQRQVKELLRGIFSANVRSLTALN